MEREEHLAWAKARAREYLSRGDAANAIASMTSDLQKHDAWRGNSIIAPLMLMATMDGTLGAARRFVEGFN